MSAPSPHKFTRPADDDEEDPVDKMIKKTGCSELSYAVQECFVETRDWRQCQKQIGEFKKCIDDFKKSQTSKK
ncbi:Cytochrome oxidase assembly factor 4 [Mactra antiquata]